MNPNPGYIVEQQADYVLMHFQKVLAPDDFDRAVAALIDLVDHHQVKKLLLFTEVKFADVDPASRLEGMRVAQNFSKFDKIAVCATNPQELKYLSSSTSLLILSGVIKDPDNFKHFSDLARAKRWIAA